MLETHCQFKHEGLPREVLAWLRCLQLPRFLRFPRRDLSNGFLVATICSRYWKNISMHSYEDKLSVVNKRNNWEQLKKHFQQNNCPLSDRMIEGLIACREGYAESLLRQLYTLLTGREVLEAAPLPAVEITPPTVVHTSVAKKVDIEATADHVEERKVQSNRVRGIMQRGFVPIQPMENEVPPPAVDDASSRVLHSMAQDPADEDVGSSGGGGAEGTERPPVAFSISMRRSEVQPTVVCATGGKAGRRSSRSTRDVDPDLGDLGPTYTEEMSALNFIEDIVRSQGTGLKPPPSQLSKHSPGIKIRDEAAYTSCFLSDETAVGTLLQCRVWSSLLSRVGDVAAIILRDGSNLSEVAALFLREPPKRAQRCQSVPGSPRGRNTSDLLKLTSSAASASGQHASQRYMFLASVMSNISDVDAFLAVSLYRDDILHNAKEAMRRLDHIGADNHAALLCSALPADRAIALKLLPDIVSHVYNVVTQQGGASARTSFLLFLAAVVTRVTRDARAGGGSANRTQRMSSVLDSARSSAELGLEDSLSETIFTIAGYHVIGALSHESTVVRLAGARLAEVLVSRGCSRELLIDTILPLLSSCCSIPTTPLFTCVCVGWLRRALQRLCGWTCDKTWSNCISPSGTVTVSPASLMQADSFFDGEHRNLPDHVVYQLAVIMRNIRQVLRRPGSANLRLYIAEQLSLCLNDIPHQNESQALLQPQEVAVDVLRALKDAPEKAVESFFSPVLPPAVASATTKWVQIPQSGPSLVQSPLIGSLLTTGRLCDCYPLALSEAVLLLFPQDELSGTEGSPGRIRLTRDVRRQNGGAAPTPSGASPGTVKNGSFRMSGGKKQSVAYETTINENMAQRVTWLYKINVSCRSGNSFPERSANLPENISSRRWVAVFQAMYSDILALTNFSETIFSRKLAVTDESTNNIARLGGMAQQLVAAWHKEVCRDGLGSVGSRIGTGTQVQGRNQGSTLLDAMAWYNGLCRNGTLGKDRYGVDTPAAPLLGSSVKERT